MVSRRRVLRTGLTGAAAVAGTAAALRPMVAAGRPARGRGTGAAAAEQDAKSGASDLDPLAGTPLFDEFYRDRHLQGFTSTGPSGVLLLVDGRPLELMRRVDGSFISMADHFQPYPTALATARAAVDVIGSAELADAAAAHHH